MSETINAANNTAGGAGEGCAHEPGAQNSSMNDQERVMGQIDAYSIALSFTMMLGQKAWMYLGKIASNPETNEVKIDLPQAQFAIDCMAAVLEKLRGRAGEREINEIQNMITNLRLNYVSAVKDGEKGNRS